MSSRRQNTTEKRVVLFMRPSVIMPEHLMGGWEYGDVDGQDDDVGDAYVLMNLQTQTHAFAVSNSTPTHTQTQHTQKKTDRRMR